MSALLLNPTVVSIILSIELQSSVGVITGIFTILVLLGCSAAVSASETAFFSLSPAQLQDIKASKSPASQRISHLLSTPKKLLATLLIVINLVNVGIVIISTYLINKYLDFSANPVWGFVFQVVVITSILLLLGEIIPKIFANRNPVKIASAFSLPILILQRVLSPLGNLMVNSTNFIEKRQLAKGHDISLDDISNAIDITADGKTDEEDRRLMKSITRFGNINVREIMSPRVDVTAVDKTLSFTKLLDTIIGSGYSRIPVYEETPDTITGILYIKDLLPHLNNDGTFEWQKLIRPAFFVPENKPINDLLQEFQEKKIHMAVIVDEYGGTSGVITLEDIIEEIVGEINDEFDTDAEDVNFHRVNDTTYIFEGKTSLNDFCRVIGVDDRIFDEAKGESESLAGLMLELSGKMPQSGEMLTFEGYTFKIISADKRRIKKVKITLPASTQQ